MKLKMWEVKKMSWDKTWESIYQERGFCNRYPAEDVITFVMREFGANKDDNAEKRILELGCGTGPNLWFFAREGFEVFGIDGSETAVKTAENFLRAEGHHSVNLAIGDINNLSVLYEPGTFDAIVDGNCLQHNKLDNMSSIVKQCYNLLKPEGVMYGRLVQSDVEAAGNRALTGWGYIRQTSLEETERVFSPFEQSEINERWQSWNNRLDWLKCWQIIARKSSLTT